MLRLAILARWRIFQWSGNQSDNSLTFAWGRLINTCVRYNWGSTSDRRQDRHREGQLNRSGSGSKSGKQSARERTADQRPLRTGFYVVFWPVIVLSTDASTRARKSSGLLLAS
jgi:hypothetical protein